MDLALRVLGEKEIQLLEILPSHDDEGICCRITTQPLNSALEYVAVSYTGGRYGPHCHIQLNGQEFPVRKNLWQSKK